MRICPGLNRFTRNVLYFENKISNKPLVFLTHPNEFIDEEPEGGPIERRASNLISYYLNDILKHKLKIKNLGSKALPLLEKELSFFQRGNFSFTTCKEYYDFILSQQNHQSI